MAKNSGNSEGAQGANSVTKDIKYRCNHNMWFNGEPASIDLRKASQKQLRMLKEKYPVHFY